MTRKDYALIASVIATEIAVCGDGDDGNGARAICSLAQEMADALRATNPQFDRARFLQACGVTDQGSD